MRNYNGIIYFYHPINITANTKRSILISVAAIKKNITFEHLHESKVHAIWLRMFLDDYESGKFKTPELQDLYEQGEVSNKMTSQSISYLPFKYKGVINEITEYFGEKKQITYNRILSTIYILPELLNFRSGIILRKFINVARDMYEESGLKIFKRIIETQK